MQLAQQQVSTRVRLTDAQVDSPTIGQTGGAVEHQFLLASDPYCWRGVVVRYYDMAPHPESVEMPGPCLSPFETILLLLQGSHTLTTRCNGYTYQDRMCPGSVCLLPRGTTSVSSWTDAAQVLHIYLSSGLIARLAAELGHDDPDHVEIQWQFNLRDPLIQQTGLALKTDLEQGCPVGPLYAESLAQSLALHLLRNYSSLSSLRQYPAQRGVSCEIQHVLSYIEEHLEEPLTLAVLAAVGNISPSHLARQVKQATGQAPHQYLLQRRVERARELLSEGRLTIAEVAAATGFVDQSHLDRYFKRLTGMQPRDVVRPGEEHTRRG
jgi:AraC family transcriptional regulator